MAQDENILRSSYSGGGTTGSSGVGDGVAGGGLSTSSSCRSKKVKQKKVPQRGLGVAQLERIRIEEQQRKEALQAANTLANNVIGSLGDSVQCPTFRPTITNSANLMPSPNVLHRPAPSVQNIPKQLNAGAVQTTTLESISSPRRANCTKLWGGEFNVDEEKRMMEIGYFPKVNLPYEDASVSTHPNLTQRSHQFQHPHAMVNASSDFSSSSLQQRSRMEPPSNQNFYVNSNRNSSPEEEKMTVGVKRSYPFSLDSPPASSFRCNIPPSCAASRSRTDELVSSSSRLTAYLEPRNKQIRESPSLSVPASEPEWDLTEVIKDNERLKGEFLSLAPPSSAASLSLNSKHEQLMHFTESSDLKSSRSQENRGQILRLGPSGSTEHPFCFFPVKYDTDQTAIRLRIGNDEPSETIDLSLKL